MQKKDPLWNEYEDDSLKDRIVTARDGTVRSGRVSVHQSMTASNDAFRPRVRTCVPYDLLPDSVPVTNTHGRGTMGVWGGAIGTVRTVCGGPSCLLARRSSCTCTLFVWALAHPATSPGIGARGVREGQHIQCMLRHDVARTYVRMSSSSCRPGLRSWRFVPHTTSNPFWQTVTQLRPYVACHRAARSCRSGSW